MNELDFPLREFENRVSRIQEKMREKGLDAFIALGSENIHYICGYDGAFTAPMAEFSGVIVPASGEPKLLIRSVEVKTAKKQSTKSPQIYGDWEGPWGALKNILEEFGAARGTIGVEENVITLKRFNQLKEKIPEAKIVNVAGLVESMMGEPSNLEIEYIKKAARIAQAGFQRAIDTIKEGVPYYEIITEAERAMYVGGMTEQRVYGSFILTCVWAGPDGGAMHETDVTRNIQRHDLVTPEIWGNYKHYVAGAQGTVYVGERPASGVIDTYKRISEVYVAIRDAMRPGVTCEEAWAAGSKVYRRYYGIDYYRMFGRQRGAGGVGRIAKGVAETLRPGVTYLVQPQVNDPLLITVAASLMVTKDGCEEITKPLLELLSV